MSPSLKALFLPRVALIFAVLAAAVCTRADYQFSTLANVPSSPNGIGIAADGLGNIFVSESDDNVILKITANGVVSTFAGAAGQPGTTDANGTNARFNFPQGIAFDSAGNLYVADTGNNAIRKITPAGDVSTFAGVAGAAGGATNGSGSSASFQTPYGVAVDGADNVYVADTFNNLIRKITPLRLVSTFAGSGASGSANGANGTASFNRPRCLVADVAGNVYVADTGNHIIRKIAAGGGVTTLAGSPLSFGFVNGSGSTARFSFPHGVAIDGSGNILVADYFNDLIRTITPAGLVSTFAGSTTPGNIEGNSAQVRFDGPDTLTVDAAGNIYITDTNNNSVRKGVLIPVAPTVSVQPQGQASVAGYAVTFSVSATGTGPFTYQWKKGGVDIAGATGSTYTIASAVLGDAGTYTVVITNSAGSVTSNGAVLTVSPAPVLPVITTDPLSSAVFAGGSVTFTGGSSGSPTPTYQWQKNGINIAGATSVTLTLTNIQVGDAGSYALVATNAAGSATSRFAQLVVLVPQANATIYEVKASPTGVTVGGNVNLEYKLTNIGTRNWGSNHYLSIRDSNGTFVAFSTLIGTNAGESRLLNLNFPAPMTPGTYNYTVQGLENGVEFFTTQTTFTLTVLAQEGNSITYNATNFPITATPGSNIIFTYNVTNTGTSSWGTNHALALRDGAMASLQLSSLNGISPGLSKTVNFSFTAPTTPGVYAYHVQAVENGTQFFTARADLVLTVLAPQPNAVIYTKTRSQDNVMPGSTVSLRFSLNNAGTGTWGASHYASLRDNNGTFLAFVPLNGIAPGGSTTVNFSFVAPTTPGSYSYFVQALQDGVEFFDKQELVVLNVLATPLANAASYNATTFPITVGRGGMVNFTHNVTNRGTNTWGSNHYLALRDADTTFLGFPSLNGIAPGQSRTLNYSFTAPTSPGVYTYHVQGLESGIEFFNEADDLVLIVP